MNAQASLFDAQATQGAARKSDPRTSVEAAKKCRAGSQRARILSALQARLYGMTTGELEDELHVVKNTIASRLKQMEEDDLVYSLGVRLNRDGNEQKIWHWRTPPAQQVDVEVKGERL